MGEKKEERKGTTSDNTDAWRSLHNQQKNKHIWEIPERHRIKATNQIQSSSPRSFHPAKGTAQNAGQHRAATTMWSAYQRPRFKLSSLELCHGPIHLSSVMLRGCPSPCAPGPGKAAPDGRNLPCTALQEESNCAAGHWVSVVPECLTAEHSVICYRQLPSRKTNKQVPGWTTSHFTSAREDADRICWGFCQDSFHLNWVWRTYTSCCGSPLNFIHLCWKRCSVTTRVSEMLFLTFEDFHIL